MAVSRYGAVLENVVFEEHYREVDYGDKSVTGKMWMVCMWRMLGVFSCLERRRCVVE